MMTCSENNYLGKGSAFASKLINIGIISGHFVIKNVFASSFSVAVRLRPILEVSSILARKWLGVIAMSFLAWRDFF